MDPNKIKAIRRTRRKKHVRKKVFGTTERPRLTITRSNRNIHCQVVDDTRGVTLASASTLEKAVREQIDGYAGNRKGAEQVGTLIATRAKDAGVQRLAFDRNGYRYHGRVAALADAVRKEGIEV